jgi:hypothetical protein
MGLWPQKTSFFVTNQLIVQESKTKSVIIRPISMRENGLYRSSDSTIVFEDGDGGVSFEDLGARWRTEDDIVG